MPFNDIDCIAANTPSFSVPSDGVRLSTRAAGRGQAKTRYIRVQIGAVLAKKLCLVGDVTRLKLQFGDGADAGKIAMSVDVTNGGFEAKRGRQGRYAFTINSRSAEGLFALDFPSFTVSPVNVIERERTPPMAIFAASEAMLKVED